MSEIQRIGDLEIEQDSEYQRREWRAQKFGWAAMALIIVAALLGLFGPGLFNQAARQGDGFSLEYERFRRYQAPAELRFYIAEASLPSDQVRLSISQDYLGGVQIQQITPQPDSVLGGAGRLTYVFGRASPRQPVTITFYLTTQQIGPLARQASLADGSPLPFHQFIFP